MGLHLPIVFLPVVPPQLTRIDVGAALWIRLGQHRNHTQQNLLDALHRRPPFLGPLVLVWVFSRRMQDRYTDGSVGVDVRMEQRRLELERRGAQRVVGRETQRGTENTAFVRGVCRAFQKTVPDEKVIFRNWTSDDSRRRITCYLLVLFQKTSLGCGAGHVFSIFMLVFLAKPVGIRRILSGEVRALYGEGGATFPRAGATFWILANTRHFAATTPLKKLKNNQIDQIKVKEATNHLTI